MISELQDELDAFDRQWQAHYRTVRDAAIAAGVLQMFTDWLFTEEGKRYQELTRDVPDTLRQNELERKLREEAQRYV